MAYVYLLLCGDGSIYTGAAKDLVKRMKAHLGAGKAAAAYTRAKGAKELLCAFRAEGYADALKGEYRMKKMSRPEKEALIRDPSLIAAVVADTGISLSPLPPDAEELKAAHNLFKK